MNTVVHIMVVVSVEVTKVKHTINVRGDMRKRISNAGTVKLHEFCFDGDIIAIST